MECYQGYPARDPPDVKTDPTGAENDQLCRQSLLVERVGADVVEVMRGVGLDSRVGLGFLSAGLGWSDSCLPKDAAALVSVTAE